MTMTIVNDLTLMRNLGDRSVIVRMTFDKVKESKRTQDTIISHMLKIWDKRTEGDVYDLLLNYASGGYLEWYPDQDLWYLIILGTGDDSHDMERSIALDVNSVNIEFPDDMTTYWNSPKLSADEMFALLEWDGKILPRSRDWWKHRRLKELKIGGAA